MAFRATDVHPMYFLQRFPFAKRLLQTLVSENPRGLMTMRAMERAMHILMPEYNKAIADIPFDYRPEQPLPIVNRAFSEIGHMLHFAACGRNSFLFEKATLDFLGRTELGDIRRSDIQLPFKAFFISFGSGLDFGLPGPSNVIDGAYVEQLPTPEGEPEKLTFFITSRRTDVVGKRNAWPLWISPEFFADLDLRPDDTLAEGIERAVKSGNIPLVADEARLQSMRDAIAAARAEGFSVGLPEQTGYEREAAANREALPTVKHVLSLVGSALCYLTAISEPTIDEPLAWPDEAAPSLIERLEKGSKSESRNAQARLLDQGLMPVRIIHLRPGLPPALDPGATTSETGTGSEKSPHKRRAHYRWQRHGPGRSLVKRVRIEEIHVHADRVTSEVDTVYLVHTPDQAGTA